ncbi:MAG TPA: sodium:solute symporter family protein [Verrucomicrobiales bacterium]|nr:sodium:solute symporter family protein [Verrucomicrobiales bacterium]
MDPDINQFISETNFSGLDWGIVAIYLSLSLIIGLVVRKYVRNMSDYIGAGRAVGVRLGIATMLGTEMGLITVMYSAQKGFTGGFAAFHIAVASAIVTLIVGFSGFIVVKLREMKVLTIPEFYERRFDKKTRVLGGIMLAFGGILNMGLFLKVGSMFIVGITGMASDSRALPVVMAALLILVLVYTVMGGMVSVIVTDYVQFVVLSFGIILTTVLAIVNLGWDNIFTTVQNEMGEAGFNPLVEGAGFGPEYVMWMIFLGLVNCAIWPTSIARALAMESPEAVKTQYKWSSISFLIRFMIPYFWGICAFVFVATQAPELKSYIYVDDPVEKSNRILYAMPIFLGRILPVGVIGIMTAAMIAAFMSTHDSYLLCWSSVITQDIIAPLKKKAMTAAQRVKLTRILIVTIGVYILYWGLVYEGSDDIWDYMSVTGAIYFTGAFSLLAGGLYWKRASSTGAFAALLCGFTALLGLGPVQKKLLGFEEGIPSARVGLFTICLTVVVMIVGSLLFPDPPKSDQLTETEKGENA